MKVSIVVDDNMVVIDGKPHVVDCSSLAGLHAVQWDGSSGYIEHSPVKGEKELNVEITSILPYQALIDAWKVIDPKPPSPISIPPPVLLLICVTPDHSQWLLSPQ